MARGALALAQPRRGYRFNIDALLLAHFAETSLQQPPGRVVDLGCGCGVVGLLLARRWASSRVLLVEIQLELADLARQNVLRNGLSARVQLVHGDFRQASLWCEPDTASTLVVSNPPFYPLRWGRASPHPGIAQAKHEVSCELSELLAACERALGPGQRLALIHCMQRSQELEDGLLAAGFALERRRFVVPLPDRPPRRVLVLARRRGAFELDTTRYAAAGRASCPADEPLLIHERPGVYSRELRQILGDV